MNVYFFSLFVALVKGAWSLIMSMGWDVLDPRPPTGLLFIPRVNANVESDGDDDDDDDAG
jgi:hypothetical protein